MNRFRSIASAYILSEYTNRELLINWKPEWGCNINLDQIVDGAFFGKGYNVNREDCYFHSGREKGSEHPFVQSMIDSEDDIAYLQAGGNFYPPNMSVADFNNKKSEFYRGIPFNNPIQDEVSKFKEMHGDYMGIHLRFTDRSQFSVSGDYLSSIINSNPHSKFFICSDEISVVNQIKNYFGDRIISYNTKGVNRNSPDDLLYSLIEWLILANSKKIWYSLGSSYSYEACIYNKLSNSVEMNPNNLVLDDFIIKLDF
jgi:hypothetical protein